MLTMGYNRVDMLRVGYGLIRVKRQRDWCQERLNLACDMVAERDGRERGGNKRHVVS